jgi:hemoglobin
MDITTRSDIETLVDTFYQRIQQDELLGPVFNDVAHVHWAAHLPKMYDFWQTLLMGEGPYRGNVTTPHVALHARHPLREEHFQRWLGLWKQTVAELFAGPVADLALQRAELIAYTLRSKLHPGQTPYP